MKVQLNKACSCGSEYAEATMMIIKPENAGFIIEATCTEEITSTVQIKKNGKNFGPKTIKYPCGIKHIFDINIHRCHHGSYLK